MSTRADPPAEEPSFPRQIDAIVKNTVGWRGDILARLRPLILAADPAIAEEVKWKKPSKPEGVPVWCHNGNLCMADTLKHAVRLTFPKGAQLQDPGHLFNTRLDSKAVRAIDFYEDVAIDEDGLRALIVEAMSLNRP